jgi:CRISPR/Cas system-associated endoribonuclease Cas2
MASTRNTSVIPKLSASVPSEVKMELHNQISGIELISPAYASDDAACNLLPKQKLAVGSTTQIGFKIDFSLEEPNGILIYELKRKNTNQFNEDIISNEDEARCVQLVIVWKFSPSKGFLVVSRLIEHDKDRIWDRNELMNLAKSYYLYDLQNSIFELTYLMRDNTVLITRMNVTRTKRSCKLEITISEGSMKNDTRRPQYIGLNR